METILTLLVLCWFMVACPVLCFGFSIFADSINIGGAFEKIGITITNLVFIPLILFGNIVDAIFSLFRDADMKYAIEHANSLRSDS